MGLPALLCIPKRTQNFSKWICSCIQLTDTYWVAGTVKTFCQDEINRCLPIISCDSNKQIQFPKHCSKYRYRAVCGIYIVFPGT